MEIPSSVVVIGFGGNVGGDEAIVERFVKARAALERYSVVLHSAPLYRTAAIGPPQEPFLNTAVSLWQFDADGTATPDGLMAIVLDIERSLGRDRRIEERWGPRPIDLDVLVWGARVIRTSRIELPHPRLRERRFALEPLSMVGCGAMVLPGTGEPVYKHVKRVHDQALELVAMTW